MLGFAFCMQSAGGNFKEVYEDVLALANDLWPPFDPPPVSAKTPERDSGM